MCNQPIWIPRRGTVDRSSLLFTPTPRKDGVTIVNDEGVRGWYVPCGKCFDCARRRKNDWFVRAVKEFTYVKRRRGYSAKRRAYMVTFTFNEDYLPENNLDLIDNPSLERINRRTSRSYISSLVRHWKDRLRKRLGYFPIHFLVAERGENTNRIHLHGLIITKDWTSFEDIRNSWKYGFSWIEPLEDISGISYSLKYMLKGLLERQLNNDWLAGLVYVSHGFGSSYLDKSTLAYIFGRSQYSYNRLMTLSEAGDYMYAVPRYYINRTVKYYGQCKYPALDDWLRLCAEQEASPPLARSRFEVENLYKQLCESFNQQLRLNTYEKSS